MAMNVAKADVWAAEIADRTGGLADVLGELAGAGASLDVVLARRTPVRPGGGVVFVTPIKGAKQQNAARSAGFSPANNIGGLRVEGADKPGLGGRIARAVADAGISMRGFNASVLGNKFVAYIGFDSPEDADRAAKAIKEVDQSKKK